MSELSARDHHIRTLLGMTEDQKLVMARELLAEMIRAKGHVAGVFVTREEALNSVFDAEKAAIANGASPKVDFFLPLSNNLPLHAVR
ncbi:hypothetical protein HOU00_gp371 [Caulobacter phage CcrPW]|uniref:Uncharacterized protein n=1 Tax=Caulobacter phage CcrPW TaxID=2283271 RepID=A0A385EA74_9CAUD|nr:hypothetical protein HOU00_gp371 [Caulobacter phage CcrPW]AXQ68754.1 hypothetical protein CcrPW_gp215c [Caulobacter phage CcrPW]